MNWRDELNKNLRRWIMGHPLKDAQRSISMFIARVERNAYEKGFQDGLLNRGNNG